MERLFFQFPSTSPTCGPRPKGPTACLHDERRKRSQDRWAATECFVITLLRFFGSCESLMCYDTLQFDDYSKYAARRLTPWPKRSANEEVFPEDCKEA